MHFNCTSLAETVAAGETIFQQLKFPSCVYLLGDMGAGKTTLCQAIVRAAGYQGAVTSPTYNLIHEYQIENGTIYHMDFYRLDDPSEVQYLGLEDLWHENCLFLVEWPEKAEGFIQKPDVTINIEVQNKVRSITVNNS